MSPDTPLVLAYIVLSLYLMSAAGIVKTVAALAKEFQADPQELRRLLPGWAKGLWPARVARWLCLVAIAYLVGWELALVLLVTAYAFSAALPMPYGVFDKSFQRRLTRLRADEPELAERLAAILAAAKLS